jgi:dTDP-glucose 4,6-dehydratase
MKSILVTGGLGFIGSNIITLLLSRNYKVVNIDKISYASKKNINYLNFGKNYFFYKQDICNSLFVKKVLKKHRVEYIINVAAETHVDNSIFSPKEFIKSNIQGTFSLLEATRHVSNNKKRILFIQISTDEVYGDLKCKSASKEDDLILPSSPYSASKASADLLVSAWSRTYGLNYIITRSCNNYGPLQHSEKLIPVILKSLLEKKKIPIYGNGKQFREWIYVQDNAEAIVKIIEKGSVNQIYNIGSKNNCTNIELVKKICNLYDKLTNNKNSQKLISYVNDRPGHDLRYALNAKKIYNYIRWKSRFSLKEGLKKTIKWYLNNKSFLKNKPRNLS